MLIYLNCPHPASREQC